MTRIHNSGLLFSTTRYDIWVFHHSLLIYFIHMWIAMLIYLLTIGYFVLKRYWIVFWDLFVMIGKHNTWSKGKRKMSPMKKKKPMAKTDSNKRRRMNYSWLRTCKLSFLFVFSSCHSKRMYFVGHLRFILDIVLQWKRFHKHCLNIGLSHDNWL